jgi:DivIVA domain-containing protein
MEWFIAVVVVAILGVAAIAAAGGMGEMAKDPVRDTFQQDLPTDRLLQAADIQSLRFGVTLRGYSMSQVDDLLDRLTREAAERDARIAELVAGSAPSGTDEVSADRVWTDRSPADEDRRVQETHQDRPRPGTDEHRAVQADETRHTGAVGDRP